MQAWILAAAAALLGAACSASFLDPEATRPITAAPAAPAGEPQMRYATFAAG